MLELRVGNAMLEVAIVGEQEQAFAVMVETSARVDVGDGDVFLESMSCTRELALRTERFIEKDIALGQAMLSREL